MSAAASNQTTQNKLPPYGAELARRIEYGCAPFLVFVCIGKDGWQQAREYRSRCGPVPEPIDHVALVWPVDAPPDAYQWPVDGCIVVINWPPGLPRALIDQLIDVLLADGAASVTARPLFVDHESPLYRATINRSTETGKDILAWEQSREMIRTYFRDGP